MSIAKQHDKQDIVARQRILFSEGKRRLEIYVYTSVGHDFTLHQTTDIQEARESSKEDFQEFRTGK